MHAACANVGRLCGGGRARNGEETTKNDDAHDNRPIVVVVAVFD